MRGIVIILCTLAVGCFDDTEPLGGGTDEGESSSGGEAEGASASSTSAATTGTGSADGSSSSGPSDSTVGAESSGSESGSSDESDTGSGSTGETAAPIYEPCAADDECETGLCLLADGARSGYCTEVCAEHAECPGYPMLPSGLTISCAGSFGPAGEPVCLLSCFENPPGECPVGTTCGSHDYNGEPYGGLCG